LETAPRSNITPTLSAPPRPPPSNYSQYTTQIPPEDDDIPDIICDDELEPVGFNPNGFSEIPSFSNDTCLINGLWSFHFDDCEIELDSDVSNSVEKDYINGKFVSEGMYSG
jgi:hypothetical protein